MCHFSISWHRTQPPPYHLTVLALLLAFSWYCPPCDRPSFFRTIRHFSRSFPIAECLLCVIGTYNLGCSPGSQRLLLWATVSRPWKPHVHCVLESWKKISKTCLIVENHCKEWSVRNECSVIQMLAKYYSERGDDYQIFLFRRKGWRKNPDFFF